VAEEVKTAEDAVIIGSPVYWRNVTAQLKALFDRTFSYGHRLLEAKLGGAIAVGRGEGAGQTLVHTAIHNYLLSCGALVVPGDLNALSVRADKPGDVLSQQRRLDQARILARNLMKYAERLREL